MQTIPDQEPVVQTYSRPSDRIRKTSSLSSRNHAATPARSAEERFAAKLERALADRYKAIASIIISVPKLQYARTLCEGNVTNKAGMGNTLAALKTQSDGAKIKLTPRVPREPPRQAVPGAQLRETPMHVSDFAMEVTGSKEQVRKCLMLYAKMHIANFGMAEIQIWDRHTARVWHMHSNKKTLKAKPSTSAFSAVGSSRPRMPQPRPKQQPLSLNPPPPPSPPPLPQVHGPPPPERHTYGSGVAHDGGRGALATHKIFVGGLPPSTSKQQLRACFEEYGTLAPDGVVKFTGFAFVTFNDEAVARKLCQKHHVTIDGSRVEVKAWTPKEGRDQLAPSPSNRMSNTFGVAYGHSTYSVQRQRHDRLDAINTFTNNANSVWFCCRRECSYQGDKQPNFLEDECTRCKRPRPPATNPSYVGNTGTWPLLQKLAFDRDIANRIAAKMKGDYASAKAIKTSLQQKGVAVIDTGSHGCTGYWYLPGSSTEDKQDFVDSAERARHEEEVSRVSRHRKTKTRGGNQLPSGGCQPPFETFDKEEFLQAPRNTPSSSPPSVRAGATRDGFGLRSHAPWSEPITTSIDNIARWGWATPAIDTMQVRKRSDCDEFIWCLTNGSSKSQAWRMASGVKMLDKVLGALHICLTASGRANKKSMICGTSFFAAIWKGFNALYEDMLRIDNITIGTFCIKHAELFEYDNLPSGGFNVMLSPRGKERATRIFVKHSAATDPRSPLLSPSSSHHSGASSNGSSSGFGTRARAYTASGNGCMPLKDRYELRVKTVLTGLCKDCITRKS